MQVELTKGEKEDLERLIDHKSFCAVVRALIEICHEKSDHMLSTWQDDYSAKEWQYNAKKLTSAEKDMVY